MRALLNRRQQADTATPRSRLTTAHSRPARTTLTNVEADPLVIARVPHQHPLRHRQSIIGAAELQLAERDAAGRAQEGAVLEMTPLDEGIETRREDLHAEQEAPRVGLSQLFHRFGCAPVTRWLATRKSGSGPGRQHLVEALRYQHRLRPGFELSCRRIANPLANGLR